MNKNVVLYIDAMIMPDKNAAAQRATAICKSLMDIGRKPVVVGLDENITKKSDIISTLKVFENIDCFAVKYPKTKMEWINRMTTIRPFMKVINKYEIENIEAIIAMDYEIIALYRLKRFCKKNNIKLIVDSVEWYGKSTLKFPMNIVKDIDTFLRMKCLYPKVDYMICISSYLYNYYRKYVNNIIEIPGTIDPKHTKWEKIYKYNPQNNVVIGYAGHPGYNYEKERLDLLIKAICEVNSEKIPCKLIIAGISKEEVESISPELRELQYYANCIEFLGKISHLECLNMIASSDFSAIIREDKRVTQAGFPTKLSESFACRTPVITTPSSNIREYIKNEYNGIVTKDFEYDSIKLAIKEAASLSKEERLKMHANLINDLEYNKFNNKLKCFFN